MSDFFVRRIFFLDKNYMKRYLKYIKVKNLNVLLRIHEHLKKHKNLFYYYKLTD